VLHRSKRGCDFLKRQRRASLARSGCIEAGRPQSGQLASLFDAAALMQRKCFAASHPYYGFDKDPGSPLRMLQK
jgi:hypothetical protein